MKDSKKCLRLGSVVLFWLFCLFVCCFPCISFAQEQEKTYQITQSQVDRLRTEFNLQKALLNKLIKNEQQQKQESILLKQDLTESRKALNRQKELLTKSEQALNDANQLLTKYAKQEEAKIRKIKRERNICLTILCGVLIYQFKN